MSENNLNNQDSQTENNITIKDKDNSTTLEQKEEKKRSIKKKKHKSSSSNKKKSRKRQKTKPKEYKKYLIFFFFVLIVGSAYFLFEKKDSLPENQDTSIVATIQKESPTQVETFANQKTDQQSYNYQTSFTEWSPASQYKLRDIIKEYTIDNNFYQASVNASKMEYLWKDKDPYTNLITKKDINLIKTGYPYLNTLGIVLSPGGEVINVLQDSPAYIYGIRIGWKLLKTKGQFISNYPDDMEELDKILENQEMTWLTSSYQIKNIPPMKKYPAIGSIAEGWVQNNILTIKLYHISNITPGRIIQIFNSNLRKNPKISGVILDIRDTNNNDSYKGLAEMAWIFNKQRQQSLMTLYDRNNKAYNISTNPITFKIDPNLLQTINRIPVIVVTNDKTSGSFEVLANIIRTNGGKVLGNKTANKSSLTTPFIIEGQKGVNLTTLHIKLPDNKTLPIIPDNSFPFNTLDSLYYIKKR